MIGSSKDLESAAEYLELFTFFPPHSDNTDLRYDKRILHKLTSSYDGSDGVGCGDGSRLFGMESSENGGLHEEVVVTSTCLTGCQFSAEGMAKLCDLVHEHGTSLIRF